MSRESLIFLLGFIIFFTSFLGIPRDWKEAVFITSGIVLMVIGYSLRRSSFLRSIDTGRGERRSDAFVENTISEEPHEHTEETS